MKCSRWDQVTWLPASTRRGQDRYFSCKSRKDHLPSSQDAGWGWNDPFLPFRNGRKKEMQISPIWSPLCIYFHGRKGQLQNEHENCRTGKILWNWKKSLSSFIKLIYCGCLKKKTMKTCFNTTSRAQCFVFADISSFSVFVDCIWSAIFIWTSRPSMFLAIIEVCQS